LAKKKTQKQDKKNKFIPDHIQHALVANYHPPMYLMHKYWARKPANVVQEYIKHYTKPGEKVLDPFCGSGVTVIEALKTGRKAVGVDLDPVSYFITKMTGIYVDIEKLKNAFEKIKKSIENKVQKYYETQCNNCKKIAHIRY